MNPQDIKAESEKQILAMGGNVCEWLPWLDRTQPRDTIAAADRSLMLHAMLQIHFGAPTYVIASWLTDNQLEYGLSRRERELLSKRTEDIDQQEKTDLYWYIEALWTMVWAGTLISDLAVDQPVGENLASLLPDIRRNEDASGFRRRYRLRPFDEVFRMLDLYFRAHWYARDGQLNGRSTEPFQIDSIMERRKALEWLADRSIEDWDDTPEDT